MLGLMALKSTCPLSCLILAALFMLAGCMTPPSFDEDAWRGQVAAEDPAKLHAPHYDAQSGGYFNPWLPQEKRGVGDLMRWRLSSNPLSGVQAPDLPRVDNPAAYLKDRTAPDSITWAGHATYAIQLGGQVLLTDPMFADDIWWVVGRKAPPAFGPKSLPADAVVLISHNHYDHLNEDSVRPLAEKGLVFVCPLGLGDILREWGAKEVVELDWWQSVSMCGVRITSLPVQHWSRRLGMEHNTSLWCGFMLEQGGRKVFYGADSGYFVGFAEYGRLYPDMDAALLGMGAYEPRWFMHYAHMDVAETMLAFEQLGARFWVPTQWGVFALGDEPATWPLKQARDWLKQHPDLKDHLKMLPVGGRLMLATKAEEPASQE